MNGWIFLGWTGLICIAIVMISLAFGISLVVLRSFSSSSKSQSTKLYHGDRR